MRAEHARLRLALAHRFQLGLVVVAVAVEQAHAVAHAQAQHPHQVRDRRLRQFDRGALGQRQLDEVANDAHQAQAASMAVAVARASCCSAGSSMQ